MSILNISHHVYISTHRRYAVPAVCAVIHSQFPHKCRLITFVDVPLNEYDIFFHVELFNPSLAQNDFHQIVPRACVLFTTRSKLLAVPSLTYIPTV